LVNLMNLMSLDDQERTNETLQRAVDAVAAAGGGVVEVPAGTYWMRDALHLRDGVRVVGEPRTVLLKAPSISVPLRDYLGYGHYEFTVTEPDRLAVGMGVHLTDDGSMGFYDTVATIVGRDGGLFFIDRMLNHDYQPRHNGRVTTIFPLVDGHGVSDAAVESLTLDGNPAEAVRLNGCRGGGVFLIGSRRVRVERVEVRHFNGDAVSFQQCADIAVAGCHVHHNAGSGLHPGSGSVRYVMQDNRCCDNGGCGLFYCLRTTHSICAGNRFERNGEAGISVGERDTDHWIRDNHVAANAGHGVEFRRPLAHGGDRVRLEGNRFEGNHAAAAAPERVEIDIPAGLCDVHVGGNRFAGGGRPLRVEPGCQRITCAGNTVDGRAMAAADVGGPARFGSPEGFPPVGPEALPLDGARHLGFGPLPPWRA
jgi:hypothetical protein